MEYPWLSTYGELPYHLSYSKKSMSETVLDTAAREGSFPSMTFMGRSISYTELAKNIDATARAFYALGVRKGDRVMVCLPNIPQAIYSLYGLNRIGAIATMVHPLSAVGEIVYDINEASCEYIVGMDQFYDKLVDAINQRPVKKLIIASISPELPWYLSPLYRISTERTFPKVKRSSIIMRWSDFLKGAAAVKDGYIDHKDPSTEAVVLFSGGTTGVSKGIRLSDDNFNAMALQTETMAQDEVRHSKMLAAMPVFHGFGLGVCIHTMQVAGGTSILVPRFNVKSYAGLIKKDRPNYIAGVPTLYLAIATSEYLDGVDLSCLRGVFSGGDSLSVEIKKRFDQFLAEHHATIRIREGYGMTECVSASCLTPHDKEKEGSIGIPYPDMVFRICKEGDDVELPYGTEGEICISGPSVMLGYINHKEENESTLHTDADGRVWLHTGDLGLMDEDGFVYFRQRIKRMIVTSGYNVYPSQIENVLEKHPAVKLSCVIGVPHPYKIQVPKAFITLNEGHKDTPELRKDIFNHCRRNIARYAMISELEIRDSLPTTMVGKVAYRQLQ